jgi:hypothetical protein
VVVGGIGDDVHKTLPGSMFEVGDHAQGQFAAASRVFAAPQPGHHRQRHRTGGPRVTTIPASSCVNTSNDGAVKHPRTIWATTSRDTGNVTRRASVNSSKRDVVDTPMLAHTPSHRAHHAVTPPIGSTPRLRQLAPSYPITHSGKWRKSSCQVANPQVLVEGEPVAVAGVHAKIRRAGYFGDC